jgi:hypothetical protein
MSNGIDWFRWHHGSVTDPKFLPVARRSGASLSDVVAVWAYLLEQASAAGERGKFGEINAEALDCLFNFPDERTAEIMKAMESNKLIAAGYVVSWEKRQPKREREDVTAAERKRQQRAREATAGEVTPPESTVTTCHTMSHQKTPREEESREEEKETQIKQKPVAKQSVEARGSRLPDDWHPTAEDTLFCKTERPDLRPSEVAQRFYDYWTAQPGAKGRKSNWSAVWRNWVRNEKGGTTQNATGSSKFQIGNVDHSGTEAAAAANLAQRGTVVPETGEITFD